MYVLVVYDIFGNVEKCLFLLVFRRLFIKIKSGA